MKAHASRELRILRVGGERLVEVAEVVDGLEGAHIRREVPVDEPPVLARLRELAEATADRRQEPEHHQRRALS